MPGWRCSHCDKPQAAEVVKTFVPAGEQADGVWTTVAVCPKCAEAE